MNFSVLSCFYQCFMETILFFQIIQKLGRTPVCIIWVRATTSQLGCSCTCPRNYTVCCRYLDMKHVVTNRHCDEIIDGNVCYVILLATRQGITLGLLSKYDGVDDVMKAKIKPLINS